jgi:hypothetical protein
MLRKLARRRPSHATVVAYLALFVALGGTSAVALSGTNTVFSDDVANDNFNSPTEGQGGLVASDLRAGSVGSSEVANGTLKAEDYGIGSVSGARIQDNNVTGLDIAEGAVFGGDIRDFALNDEDVGQATLVDFALNIGSLNAGDCEGLGISQVAQPGDHMLLTPADDAHFAFDYRVFYNTNAGLPVVEACNRSGITRDDGTTHFSLLVFDAQ